VKAFKERRIIIFVAVHPLADRPHLHFLSRVRVSAIASGRHPLSGVESKPPLKVELKPATPLHSKAFDLLERHHNTANLSNQFADLSLLQA
jgi:hypothetical protein